MSSRHDAGGDVSPASDDTEMLAAALDYTARGWPVLPLRAGAKVPATAHGLHDASTDADTIRAWWAAMPDANVAVRTGVAFDVCDIDGDDGIEEMSRLIGGDEIDLPPGPAVITPRGVHLYYRPTGMGNRAGFRPGLDWRGVGGYVVVPPSTVAGAAYRWWPAESLESPVEAAPDWLVSLLSRPATAPAPQPIRAPHPFAQFARTRGYAEAALAAECDAVAHAPVGTRNDQLNRAAFALGTLAAAGDVDVEHVVGRLLGAALTSGLSDREARQTIESGLRAGLDQPRSR